MAKITFDTIAGGELAERFKVALAQIGRNIMDQTGFGCGKRNDDQLEI